MEITFRVSDTLLGFLGSNSTVRIKGSATRSGDTLAVSLFHNKDADGLRLTTIKDQAKKVTGRKTAIAAKVTGLASVDERWLMDEWNKRADGVKYKKRNIPIPADATNRCLELIRALGRVNIFSKHIKTSMDHYFAVCALGKHVANGISYAYKSFPGFLSAIQTSAATQDQSWWMTVVATVEQAADITDLLIDRFQQVYLSSYTGGSDELRNNFVPLSNMIHRLKDKMGLEDGVLIDAVFVCIEATRSKKKEFVNPSFLSSAVFLDVYLPQHLTKSFCLGADFFKE